MACTSSPGPVHKKIGGEGESLRTRLVWLSCCMCCQLTKLNGHINGKAFSYCNKDCWSRAWCSSFVVKPCIFCFLVLLSYWSTFKAAKKSCDTQGCKRREGVVRRWRCLLSWLVSAQRHQYLSCFWLSKTKKICYRLKIIHKKLNG